MIELTEHQGELGISVKFISGVHHICVDGMIVSSWISETSADTFILDTEKILDTFLKSRAFEKAAAKWAYQQGWKDPDGN